MKVHLISKQAIDSYILENARSKASFEIWYSILKNADWYQPKDIISTFCKSDILGNKTDRVVFNVGGNNYRLICKYHFGKTKVHLFIKWIGTHAEYSRVCSEGKQFIISSF